MTTASLPTIDLRSARAWRAWLRTHHTTSTGVWLVFHKVHTGVDVIPDEEAVRLALCFGWIDSLIKRVDEDRYARKFTPRKPDSKWSDINRRRWAELHAAGQLEPAGLAAAPTANRYAAKPTIPTLPAYIARAFKRTPRAWRFFQTLSPTCRRQYVVWIHMAKQRETRAHRIRESIALLAAGKKLGLK